MVSFTPRLALKRTRGGLRVEVLRLASGPEIYFPVVEAWSRNFDRRLHSLQVGGDPSN